MKLRFESGAKGYLTVEDLWDLPLTHRAGGLDLDNLARQFALALREAEVGSFVTKTKKSDEILKLKFDIIKYIIDVKLAEADKAEQAKVLKGKRERILQILSEKQDESLKGKSEEELKKLLEETMVTA
jgi:hypothetical protein